MSSRWSVVLLAVSILSASAVRAQERTSALPEQLTLPTLLRLVAERSPRLAAEQVAIDAAQAERIIAGVLPNPTVSYGRFKPSGGANTMFDGSRQQQTTVEMPLLIAGQRGARVEAAEQGVLAARARVGLAGNELALRAAELFVGLQAAQEKAAVLEESLGELERAVAIVSGRLASGMASRYDLTRVEMERTGVATRLAGARSEQTDKSAGLAAVIGAPGWRPSASGAPAPSGLSTGPAAWRDLLAAHNPQIIAARREEEAAQAAVTRAGLERWPVPVLSVGRSWTSDPYGASNFVGLSTEIPLLDSRRGQFAKAEADYRAAQRRREAIEHEAGVELLRLLDGLAQRRASLEKFERGVAERIPALKQMAEDAYRLGRGSILELIDAARSRLDARLTGIELRSAAVEQEYRILALTGKLGE